MSSGQCSSRPRLHQSVPAPALLLQPSQTSAARPPLPALWRSVVGVQAKTLFTAYLPEGQEVPAGASRVNDQGDVSALRLSRARQPLQACTHAPP